MNFYEKLVNLRKDLIVLIGLEMDNKEAEYILGLHRALILVDDYIISELKGENNV